jgi:hypothetical protein
VSHRARAALVVPAPVLALGACAGTAGAWPRLRPHLVTAVALLVRTGYVAVGRARGRRSEAER